MMPSTRPAHGPVGDEEFVKDLVLEYIQGKSTATELRSRVAADPLRSHLLDLCPTGGSLPQKLLKAVGLSAYDMEIAFKEPPVITRSGLRRNLELVRQRSLSVESLCEWSTDRLAWDIVEGRGCEDEVVGILADEFTHGEDYAQRITSSGEFLSLIHWYLDHASPQDSNIVRVGVFIEHWRSSLRKLLVGGAINESTVEAELSEFFRPVREHAPTIVQDFVSALHRLGHQRSGKHIEELITCTTRTGQPVTCVDRILAGEGTG